MITMVDAFGKTSYASPAVSRKFGYTPEECLGLNMADVVHPDDVAIMHEFVGRIMMHPGVPMKCPSIRDRKKDGSYIWVEGTLTNFLETEGINAIVANFRDVTEKKIADESNRFKASLLNRIGQAAIATDKNGLINYWNQAASDLYGWTKQEALGSKIEALIPTHATVQQLAEITEYVSNGRTWSGEFRVRRKDGSEFPAVVTNSPIFNDQNELCGIIGISSDSTEKKNLEALVAKANRLAAIGSFEIDVVNETVFWSDITKEIREVHPDFVPKLNEGISYFKEGRDKDTITKRVKDCIESGIAWDDELQIVTYKGNSKWVRTIGNGEFVDGKCIKVYGSFQDINARKKAELEALKAFEEKNIILESIGEAFFAVDKHSRVTYWNNKAEILIGKCREDVIGNNLSDIFRGIVDAATFENDPAATTEHKDQHFETYSESLEKWLDVRVYPSDNGLTGYLRDITDRRLGEMQRAALNLQLNQNLKELAASNQELEDFAYVASHDLQEPLRMVTGFLGQIEKKYSDVIDDKGRQYIHFAVDGANRMRQIILDLIEFSRIGRIADTGSFIDSADIVRDVISLCKKQIQETKAVVNFENLPSLVTYPTSLRQVFQNLVSNALKYHVKGRRPLIEISATSMETHWQFAIADNGIGIEEEYFNKIFVIFQRLHNKNAYSGTGIGLAVCKKIIEHLGGTIWLTSRPGEGTTFYFTILKR